MIETDTDQGGFPGTPEGRKMKLIQISIKQVYGNVLYYPANEAAGIFASIAGKKTFSQKDISNILALGFEIQYVNAYEALEV